MNIICVDDEDLVLRLTTSLCQDIAGNDSLVEPFLYAQDALDWLGDGNTADVALLDIDMPDMNGLVLAAKIKEKSPDTAIIFLTGYSQFAVDAFALHASGYLMKPVSKEKLAEEIRYATTSHPAQAAEMPHIAAVTFGNFDLLVDGRPVLFARAKSKEMLAYLVDRQGGSVTRAEVFAALWEDGFYDRSMQKQLDVILRSLRFTLEEAGIPEILEIQRGSVRVRSELISCDLYRFLAGDVDAVNAYRGEYMSSYAWAELTEAYIERRMQND